jgi:hypothetical protein
MKKLSFFLLIAGFSLFLACGPSKKEKEAAIEKSRQDSIKAAAEAMRQADSINAATEAMRQADSINKANEVDLSSNGDRRGVTIRRKVVKLGN